SISRCSPSGIRALWPDAGAAACSALRPPWPAARIREPRPRARTTAVVILGLLGVEVLVGMGFGVGVVIMLPDGNGRPRYGRAPAPPRRSPPRRTRGSPARCRRIGW